MTTWFTQEDIQYHQSKSYQNALRFVPTKDLFARYSTIDLPSIFTAKKIPSLPAVSNRQRTIWPNLPWDRNHYTPSLPREFGFLNDSGLFESQTHLSDTAFDRICSHIWRNQFLLEHRVMNICRREKKTTESTFEGAEHENTIRIIIWQLSWQYIGCNPDFIDYKRRFCLENKHNSML